MNFQTAMRNSMSEKYRELFLTQTAFKTPTQTLKDALDSVANFVAEMGAQHEGNKAVRPHWLTLSGISGCGKTMLAQEVHKFASRYYEFYKTEEGFSDVRNIYFNKILDMADEWKSGCWRNQFDEQAWLLVVDDLGVERDTSGFIKDRLFTLLEKRLNKWTLITTNLKLKTIQDSYDVRIASRIIRDGNRYRPFKSGDWWLSQYAEESQNG